MYAAWSPTGEYLAATSDSLHALAVWRVTVHDGSRAADEAGGGISAGDISGDVVDPRLLRLEERPELARARRPRLWTRRVDGGQPAFPVARASLAARRRRVGAVVGSSGWRTFATTRTRASPCGSSPSDGHVVVWAERGGRVHAYDLRCAHAASLGSSSAVNLSPPPEEDGHRRSRVRYRRGTRRRRRQHNHRHRRRRRRRRGGIGGGRGRRRSERTSGDRACEVGRGGGLPAARARIVQGEGPARRPR